MKDTNKELERLERELLADISGQPAQEAAPAFDDPEAIYTPADPMVYCNYSNDYGKTLQEFADNGGQLPKKKNTGLLIALLLAACGVCLILLGLLVYRLDGILT